MLRGLGLNAASCAPRAEPGSSGAPPKRGTAQSRFSSSAAGEALPPHPRSPHDVQPSFFSFQAEEGAFSAESQESSWLRTESRNPSGFRSWVPPRRPCVVRTGLALVRRLLVQPSVLVTTSRTLCLCSNGSVHDRAHATPTPHPRQDRSKRNARSSPATSLDALPGSLTGPPASPSREGKTNRQAPSQSCSVAALRR